MTRRPPLVITEITTLSALESIEHDWADLWRRAGPRTTFQRPQWLLAWMRHFPVYEPWIIAARRDGRLTGLAPLFVYQSGVDRVIAPIGAGISDYLDVLVEHGDVETLAAMLGWIDGSDRKWDVVDLVDLPRTSPLLRARLPDGWAGELSINDD